MVPPVENLRPPHSTDKSVFIVSGSDSGKLSFLKRRLLRRFFLPNIQADGLMTVLMTELAAGPT